MDYTTTKYPAAVPLKNIVADALFSIFADLGFPEELLPENSSNLTDALVT